MSVLLLPRRFSFFFFRVGWNLSDEISNGRVGSVVGNGPFHSYEKEKEP